MIWIADSGGSATSRWFSANVVTSKRTKREKLP